jgi:hypothetical protein
MSIERGLRCPIPGDDQEVRSAFGGFLPSEIDRINQLVEGLINYAVR